MKQVTAAALLEIHGPCTAGELTTKAGITPKGIGISTLLSQQAAGGRMKKKKSANGLVFSLTPKGKEWLDGKRDEVETIAEINKRSYSKGAQSGTKAAQRKPVMTATQDNAYESFILMMEQSREGMAFLRGLHIQIGNFLDEHDQQAQPAQQQQEQQQDLLAE